MKKTPALSCVVTLKDISKKTGYTINTVSRALHNKSDISKKTTEFIKKTAREMGYISNSIAGALRLGMTNTIAIILGDISNPHFSIMVKEIEDEARSYNYTSFIINTDENEEREHEAICSALSKKVDGIIICPTQKSRENIEFLKNTGTPFVLIGRYFKDMATDYVVCDDIKGGYIATKYLLDKGHKRVLFFNGPRYISSAYERHLGYKKALKEKSIKYDKELVYEISITSGDIPGIAKTIFDKNINFTAIFAFSDMIAWEIMYALNIYRPSMQKDIDIIGFDNIQSKFLFPTNLTSVKTVNSTMSQAAVDILIKKIIKPQNKVYSKVIDTEIEVR